MSELHWLSEEVRWFGYARGPLFAFNTLLALVPLVIGYVTFRPGRRPGPGLWVGAAAFLLFLPNAAYVLTDAVHMLKDVRNTDSDFVVFTIYLPAWCTFFAVGFTSYVLAIRRVEAYVRQEWPGLPWWSLWVALQGLVALGVYLGRVVRLHSWHVITHPGGVLDALGTLDEPGPLFFIAFTAAALGLATLIWRPVIDAGARQIHRQVHALTDRW